MLQLCARLVQGQCFCLDKFLPYLGSPLGPCQPPCGSMQERLANLPACLTFFSVSLPLCLFLSTFLISFCLQVIAFNTAYIDYSAAALPILTHVILSSLSFFFPQIFCDAIISRLRCITPCRPRRPSKSAPFPVQSIPRHLVFCNRDKTNETGKYCRRKQKVGDTPEMHWPDLTK